LDCALSCEQTICATIDDEAKTNDVEEHKISICSACEYCVACDLYKLAHAFQNLHCSKLFAIGKSIVHLVLHEFVCVVNVVLKIQPKWHVGDDLIKVMIGFKDLCGLPSVHGTINATQIQLQKNQRVKIIL
jgi:hypothetical protein